MAKQVKAPPFKDPSPPRMMVLLSSPRHHVPAEALSMRCASIWSRTRTPALPI